MKNITPEQKAEKFLKEETQFHLGFLPTEQPNPLTRGLDSVCREDLQKGIQMLFSVDREIVPKAEEVFCSKEFSLLKSSFIDSIRSGGRVVFSGCGATGRLAILLESAWRKACARENHPEAADSVSSIMTGGDYALVKSVESFEDYESFGRKQAKDLGLSSKDTFVAVTEGGETSSVLGSAMRAADDAARVFVAFNNPAKLLCEKIERTRRAIERQGVHVIELCSGPMAVAGSTRMQAATIELLVLGSALESAFRGVFGGRELTAPAAEFGKLLSELGSEASLEILSEMIKFEENVYQRGGLMTYFSVESLLDIFTDTTERAPTFLLPPLTKHDDEVSSPPWAAVKNPMAPTSRAWEGMLGRKPGCIEWSREDYIRLGAGDKILKNPPQLGCGELLKFRIGNERDVPRESVPFSAAAAVLSDSDAENIEEFMEAFSKASEGFSGRKILVIGESVSVSGALKIPCKIKESPLRLWEHIAVKLVMNTISTATMARMGRVKSNWMARVEATNKKLIDRSTRLISELGGVSYEDACRELFVSLEAIQEENWSGKARPSPVQHALERIEKRNKL